MWPELLAERGFEKGKDEVHSPVTAGLDVQGLAVTG
jgi:hypothetical protein